MTKCVSHQNSNEPMTPMNPKTPPNNPDSGSGYRNHVTGVVPQTREEIIASLTRAQTRAEDFDKAHRWFIESHRNLFARMAQDERDEELAAARRALVTFLAWRGALGVAELAEDLKPVEEDSWCDDPGCWCCSWSWACDDCGKDCDEVICKTCEEKYLGPR